jgi:site-specific recombinase XerD
VNWERAIGKAERLVGRDGKPEKREVKIADAIDAYLEDCRVRGLTESTVRSYRKTLAHFSEFASHEAYTSLAALTLDTFTLFRSQRLGRDKKSPLSPSTQRKETECLRAFCAFSKERDWMEQNLAKKLRPPKESSLPTMPFTRLEIARITDAARKLGNRENEPAHWARKRALAMISLLLYSGLRISDAAKLSRAALDRSSGRLLLRVMKTGRPLYIRLSAEAIQALDELPAGKYFFWNGKTKISTTIGSLRRTLAAVGRKTKTEELTAISVHPHRFRDTFAVNLLEQDVPIRTVQLLLGHTSVRTTEKHYAPFVESQQRLLDDAVAKLDFSVPSVPGDLPHHPVKNERGNPERHVRSSTA